MTAPILYTVANALAPMDPKQWVVDGILPIASTSLWFGAPGSKKTYSLLDLAVCVAIGKPWLGFNVKQGAVLLVDEESGPSRLLRRLGEVVRGHLGDASLPIYATSLHGFNFWSPSTGTSAQTLQDIIDQISARLVIIDALADVMLGGDENTVKDTQKVFHALRGVSEHSNTKAAISLIHHSNRKGGYRGSSAILGALDLAVEVTSQPKEAGVQFRTEKTRDGEPCEWAGDCHWTPTEFWMTTAQTIVGTGHRYEKGERAVMNCLVALGGTATSNQIETATRYAPSTVRNIVSQLARLKLLTRIDGGGAGTPGTYEIDRLALADNPL